MKIVFSNNFDHRQLVFEIAAIEYEKDENNNPVDITIAANEDTLELISMLCILGCNIRETCPEDKFFNKASHVALYGRLKPFTIVNSSLEIIT